LAVRPIILYPDPVLLRETTPVERVDDEVRALVADMVDTMNAAPGIGLAANQLGVPWRVCIVDLTAGEQAGALHVFVNPVVLATEGREASEEGCLSFPGITLEIERAQKVAVEATDLDGRRSVHSFEGLMARAVLHECEHLDGKVFLQNVSPLKRELVKKEIRKRIRDGDWAEPAVR
jgi:peptide deformylase